MYAMHSCSPCSTAKLFGGQRSCMQCIPVHLVVQPGFLEVKGHVCNAFLFTLASSPGPLFIFGFERAWYAKIRHVTSFWTSVGVSMETPPFTMTSFQSAYG